MSLKSRSARAMLPVALSFLCGGTAAVAQTVPVVTAAPNPAPAMLPLTNFDSSAELARFARNGIPAANFTVTSEGARLVLEKYSPGDAEWPALILRTDKGLPGDWTDYDTLVVDAHNESATQAEIMLYVKDENGVNVSHRFTIPPGQTQTLRFPFVELGRVVPSRIREMQLFATRPPARTTFVFRNLRLETDVAARNNALKNTVDAANATFARLGKETKDPEVRAWLQSEEKIHQEQQDRLRATNDRKTQITLQTALIDGEKRVRIGVPRREAENRMRRDFAKLDKKLPYACGFATSMEKIFPVDVPFSAKVTRTAKIALAGNETESLQLLLLAGKDELKEVRVTVDSLQRTDGMASLPSSAITVSPVGFVQTKKPSYRVNYIGWHPDPILDFLSTVTVKAGEMQPMWIRVNAPPGTPPGDYKGTITIQPANAPAETLPLTVTVWGFDLPAETHLRTAVSFREPMLTQVYGSLSETMRQRYYRFLLKNRLNPDNIYRVEPPNIADLELWNREGMNAFNLCYVVKPADLKPNGPYPAEQKQQILAKLDAVIPELKAKGLYSKAYVYGFDEVNDTSFAAMKDVLGAIKAKYPDLLVMTTGYDATYGEKSGIGVTVVDGWVPLTPKYDPKRVAEARKQGKQIWWYTCIVPQAPYANWLIEYDAIDARSLMGLQTAKYKPDGYLYYALNRWPLSKKPITSGPYTDWPAASFSVENGDGSILCAGPDGPLSTIRLENIRDGLEDNEYFWLLGEEIKKLKKLKSDPRPEAVAALRQAEKASEIGSDLVRDMTHFSKSPEALYKKRQQVAEAILAARKVTVR
jgi:hypothetical protein